MIAPFTASHDSTSRRDHCRGVTATPAQFLYLSPGTLGLSPSVPLPNSARWPSGSGPVLFATPFFCMVFAHACDLHALSGRIRGSKLIKREAYFSVAFCRSACGDITVRTAKESPIRIRIERGCHRLPGSPLANRLVYVHFYSFEIHVPQWSRCPPRESANQLEIGDTIAHLRLPFLKR